MRLPTASLAAAALALGLSACAPNTTPITKRGYKGDPPIGNAIAFDPADEIDVDGDGSGDGWWWIPFDGSSAPEEEAVCANGSTTGLAISPGSGDDLLVFFDGGGACWSYETCIAGTAVDRTYGLSKFLVEARDFVPCSLTNRALLPPTLTGATIVFVPYCTGDVHGGDAVQVYGNAVFNETWHHKGHANVMAYLRRLAATWPTVDKLVVAGSSAGGFGALVNYEAFRWYWPDAQGYLVDDSGPALVNNDVPADFRDAWFNSWHLGVATDPFCLDCRNNLAAAWAELSDMHRSDRLAFVTHLQDGVMGPFMLATPSRFEEDVRQLEASFLAPTRGARAFYDAGDDHMLLTPLSACGAGSWVASHAAGPGAGLGLDAWLELMLSDDPAWSTRID